MTAHQIKDKRDVQNFIKGGKALFTLRSNKTGKRFTYKVRQSRDGNVFFVSVLRGQDNTGHYSYFAHFGSNGLKFGKKSKVGFDAPSVKAFFWFWDKLQSATPELPDSLEFWHEGRCSRCSRVLTVPESLERGIGPHCAGQLG